MSDVPALTCPKCGGDMRAYERNGVVVDQCVDCRGLFLDRGELERLADAEGRHYSREREDRPREREDRPREHKKSKKRSFLENLFEGD